MLIKMLTNHRRRVVVHITGLMYILLSLDNICQADIVDKLVKDKFTPTFHQYGRKLFRRQASNDIGVHIVGDKTEGAEEGDSMALHCITALDVRYVTWSLDFILLTNGTQVIKDDSRIQLSRVLSPPVSTYTLTINQLKRSDAGLYRCTVYYGNHVLQAFTESALHIMYNETTPAPLSFTTAPASIHLDVSTPSLGAKSEIPTDSTHPDVSSTSLDALTSSTISPTSAHVDVSSHFPRRNTTAAAINGALDISTRSVATSESTSATLTLFEIGGSSPVPSNNNVIAVSATLSIIIIGIVASISLLCNMFLGFSLFRMYRRRKHGAELGDQHEGNVLSLKRKDISNDMYAEVNSPMPLQDRQVQKDAETVVDLEQPPSPEHIYLTPTISEERHKVGIAVEFDQSLQHANCTPDTKGRHIANNINREQSLQHIYVAPRSVKSTEPYINVSTLNKIKTKEDHLDTDHEETSHVYSMINNS